MSRVSRDTVSIPEMFLTTSFSLMEKCINKTFKFLRVQLAIMDVSNVSNISNLPRQCFTDIRYFCFRFLDF